MITDANIYLVTDTTEPRCIYMGKNLPPVLTDQQHLEYVWGISAYLEYYNPETAERLG